MDFNSTVKSRHYFSKEMTFTGFIVSVSLKVEWELTYKIKCF